ncbi:MAG: sulfite exporter TauE/SafE family protein [Bacteroidales bacterium]|nr:sulfite exporter TauE/SafE family protein [Bacteroidales bacterium]
MDFIDLEWYQYALIIGAGLIAGFINTLAGSGSLLTLPLLMFIGLPPTVANGTNRIAIMLQSLVGSVGFRKQGALNLRAGLMLGIPSVLGSVAGALIALAINAKAMERAVGILLIFMFFVVLFKPEAWLKGRQEKDLSASKWLNFLIFFLIGVYGGFVQAGVGFFLLGGLVLGAGLDLVKANAIKNLLVFLYTPFALAVYMIGNQVDYKAGLILSIGSMAGAWLGTRSAVSWGPVFVRYVLLVAVLVSAIQLIFF